MNNDGFSARLRAARASRKLTQGELAELAGLQTSAVNHFETGRREPSLRNLLKLADALAVSVDYLAGRAEEPEAAGPLVARLLRDFGRMTAEDQGSFVQFASMLAAKSGKPTGKRT